MTTNGGSVHFTDRPGHQDTSTMCANTSQYTGTHVQTKIQDALLLMSKFAHFCRLFKDDEEVIPG